MRLILCMFVVLGFCFCKPTVINDEFVITNDGVANLKLGMKYLEVKDLYEVSRDDELEDEEENDYYREPLYNITDFVIAFSLSDVENDSSVICEFAIYDNKFHTEEGIGVGSTIEDVLKAYPNAILHFNQVSQRAWLEVDNIDFDVNADTFDTSVLDHDTYSDSNDTVSVKGFKLDTPIDIIRIQPLN